MDIDKILNIIKRKVLKGTYLPITIKEIQAGYLSSSFFKDLFVYLAHNKLPNKKNAIHKVLSLSQNYVLLDQLLFKLIMILDKEKALLAIPESCTEKIISLYHNALFCRTPRSDKNLSNHNQQVLYTKLNVLLKSISESLSHMPMKQK